MARPEPVLADVQRWMQEVIRHVEGGTDEALAAPEAAALVPPAAIEDVILPSPTLAAAERVQIYRSMYPLRMQEALLADYPALAHFLGDEPFERLVGEYVAVHPSRSYTLNRLGDHFAEFVAERSTLPRRAFCGELARLELAVAQVFDAEESAPLEADAVAAFGETIADAHLRPIEAFRLLELRYPVNAYLQSVRDDDHDHPGLAAERNWLAVFRRKYVIRRLPLTHPQHRLLEALAAGATLGDAVAVALRRSRPRPAPEDFFAWFREWVGAGVFRALD
jgi:hypothetical protein